MFINVERPRTHGCEGARGHGWRPQLRNQHLNDKLFIAIHQGDEPKLARVDVNGQSATIAFRNEDSVKLAEISGRAAGGKASQIDIIENTGSAGTTSMPNRRRDSIRAWS